MQLAQIRAQALTGFSPLVRELGGSPEPLLSAFGLQAAEGTDGQRMIDLRRVTGLYETAATRLNCPDFGLRLSAYQGQGPVGQLALLVYNAPTVTDALALAARYIPFESPNLEFDLVQDAIRGRHHLVHELRVDNCPERRQQIEYNMLAATRTLHLLADSRPAVECVTMRHAALLPPHVYRQHFSCPVRFGQRENAVVFDSRMLEKPVAGRNPKIHRVAQRFVDGIIGALPHGLAGKVEALISRQLPNPKCTVDLIAGQLAMHPRTLQRRLREEGVRFDVLIDNLRKSRAAEYLVQRDMRLTAIAHLLGYTRQSSLNQSCLRWFARTPLQIRAQAATDTQRR